MNKEWLYILAKRFVKMFLIGGFGAVAITLAQHPLSDFSEWESWLVILVNAFVVGGIAALEKWSRGYRPQ